MTFSYSRLTAFDSCKYKWLMKYILGVPSVKDGFFSSYGTFLHDIFAKYYRGEGSVATLSNYYINEYCNQVVGKPQKMTTAVNYFNQGFEAVLNLKPAPYEILGVEKEVHWKLGGRDYVGYIDLLLRSEDGIIIVDHKNRDLKPRSTRAKPTKTDEELSQYLRQPYMYSTPVYEEYGIYPISLQFNVYRTGLQIKERFDMQEYEKTLQWARDKADEIERNDDWSPNIDYFGCRYLCDVRNECEYNNLGR